MSRDDLKQAYLEFHKEELTDAEISSIMKEVNFSGSGKITYSEFTIAQQQMITVPKLHEVFKMFDKDGSGSISLEEIKTFLDMDDNKRTDQYIKQKFIRQADVDGDGLIDFEEFKKMMCDEKARRVSLFKKKNNNTTPVVMPNFHKGMKDIRNRSVKRLGSLGKKITKVATTSA